MQTIHKICQYKKLMRLVESYNRPLWKFNPFLSLSSNTGRNLIRKLYLDWRRLRLKRPKWVVTYATMKNFVCDIHWVSNHDLTSSFRFRFVCCLNCNVLSLRGLLLYLLIWLHGVVHRLGHFLVEILRLLVGNLWVKRCCGRKGILKENNMLKIFETYGITPLTPQKKKVITEFVVSRTLKNSKTLIDFFSSVSKAFQRLQRPTLKLKDFQGMQRPLHLPLVWSTVRREHSFSALFRSFFCRKWMLFASMQVFGFNGAVVRARAFLWPI